MTPRGDIQTAVIFLSAEDHPPAVGPFHRIAGLPLLQRQILWLWQNNILTVHILAPPHLLEAVEKCSRQWRLDRDLPQIRLHAGKALMGGFSPERAVLLDGRFLHHPGLLGWARSTPPPFAYVDEEGHSGGLGVASLQTDLRADILESLPLVQVPAGFFALRLTHPMEARQAEQRLYRSFIKTTDGWFSKHLNRRLSLAITRRIVHLPLHPNTITFFTLLIGLASGWSAAQGRLVLLAAGGILFQIASILDGVDGEVARAKLLHSRLGEWLDTVCDDLTNAIFILGVTVGMYRMAPDLWWLALGLGSLVVYAVTLWIMYRRLIVDQRQPSLLAFQEEIRRPGYRPQGIKAWLVSLQPLIKRDFYGYAFMLCGLLGIPKLLIGGWSIGAFLTLGFISTEWRTSSLGNAFGKILRKRGRS